MFDTVSSNDPRLDPRIVFTGKFWHLTIAYIAPEHESEVIYSWLQPEIIPEEVAKADKFTSAYNGELSVLTRTPGSYEDIVIPSSGGNAHYVKEAYFLTDDDKRNAIKCMQVGMKIWARKYYTHNVDMLIEQIDSLDPLDLDDAQMFMATYFDYDTAYTNGKPKVRSFDAY